MDVIAFVGPSGTGKSHNALKVAHSNQADAIIDDGLLIKDRRIIAGRSAKKEANKMLAVKRAIFILPGHADEVREAIESSQPKRIMIIGTSENMVTRIAKALKLPEISKYVYIEDISSKAEMEEAKFHRMKEGKHIIPVPTVELKPHFSGQLVDKFKGMFKRKPEAGRRNIGEKSIVRPMFSYYGKLVIDDWAVKDIVKYLLLEEDNVRKVADVKIEHIFEGNVKTGYEDQGIEINCYIVLSYGKHIPSLVQQLQKHVKENTEEMTGMVVKQVNINIKALFVQPRKL